MSRKLRGGTVLEGLPLFPLPNVVFFPRTMLPLHVFEPRYLAMLHDVLAHDRLLGVVRLREGWEEDYEGSPGISEIFGLGEVVRHEEDEDGKLNIYVRGLARVRTLEEQPSDEPYRRARVEVLSERPGASPRQLATVRHLFSNAVSRLPGADLASASVLFESDLPPGLLLDAIATAAPIPSKQKQELLDTCDEASRADLLADALAEWALPR